MYQTHRLANGIRLIHRQSASPVAHCGLLINVGSRDESPAEQGLAHFIEHVIFKGTHRRKSFHIMSHMENVGGEINAYTTKEETCIYGSFMPPYYERWFDVVSDITLQSSFPPKELLKEKDIVIDEINSYKDTPSEQIIDDFDEILYDGHPLGRNILGTPAHLKAFSRENILHFIQKHYVGEEMVICSVGAVDFQRLVHLAEKYFGEVLPQSRHHKREAFTGYRAEHRKITRQNHQAHCMTGNLAYSLHDDRKTALQLLNNILGGPGLTARLNMSVREKHGFCYHIESMYQPYTDSGAWGIYFGTDPGYVNKTLHLVYKELHRLRQNKLGSLQIKRAKNQLCGQVSMAHESNLTEMLHIGKQLLHLGKAESLEAINNRIQAVTAGEILEAANEVLDTTRMSSLIFQSE